jgi:16S rRNA (guanine527-N7)-methyltransferase
MSESLAVLLAADGIPWGPEQAAQTARYLELLRDMNAYASLVSHGDLERLESVHLPDSLSLAGFVRRASSAALPHLDIGSGSGFPAIPLAVALPGVSFVLVERSAKKIGFLRQVLGALGLRQVRLVQGEFPGAVRDLRVGSVSARAVERPDRIMKAILPFLDAGAEFLSQSGLSGPAAGGMFHVEHVEDAWTRAGLRRGSLHRIRARHAAHD